ncbi:hypothetical protein P280DRAFT_472775 [Massarina eburnea CBS 473.64]|uniref:Nudix hydrolase domain-containing protein n=1 Tax=Massarina eburnea CBS 473.64 TaxID=1395130 RepID=A0A6A6RNZ2_9PLEO|nr:hypothetical protein P280DRAFT_472775 [Massarina eburnea CBS 473.64]
MTQAPALPVEYDPSVQEYLLSEKQYLQNNGQYQVLCVGIVLFNKEGKLLLVQRAKTEKAFPEFWEIPGGKVDDSDETIVHAAIRELKEEAGLEATRIVRKVGTFVFYTPRPGGQARWLKTIFEVEVKDVEAITLDPVEHDNYLWATEDEVTADRVGDVSLKYISGDNKFVKLEAFRHRREAAAKM